LPRKPRPLMARQPVPPPSNRSRACQHSLTGAPATSVVVPDAVLVVLPDGNGSGAFHGFPDSVRLRVNVPPGGSKIAVPRQVSKGVRVHMSRPPCQASVPERVQREVRHIRQFARLQMLPLQTGFLDMSARGFRPKHPPRRSFGPSHFQNRRRPERQGNGPPCVLRLSERER